MSFHFSVFFLFSASWQRHWHERHTSMAGRHYGKGHCCYNTGWRLGIGSSRFNSKLCEYNGEIPLQPPHGQSNACLMMCRECALIVSFCTMNEPSKPWTFNHNLFSFSSYTNAICSIWHYSYLVQVEFDWFAIWSVDCRLLVATAARCIARRCARYSICVWHWAVAVETCCAKMKNVTKKNKSAKHFKLNYPISNGGKRHFMVVCQTKKNKRTKC